MKRTITLALPFLALTSFAQVEVDKGIELTGGTGERYVTNLEAPVNGTDAVNKDYVDGAVSAGGGSSLPSEISNESPTTMLFHQGVQYCANLSEGGNTDWRMPTLLEASYFSGSSASTNYFWTLSESPGMDFATNQNRISTRLSDGKWRNGGSSNFFFTSRTLSGSGIDGTSWATVGSFLPLTAGNAFAPTNISFSGNHCPGTGSHTTQWRLVYNVDGGPSITSQTYSASGSCPSGSHISNLSIPLASSVTPYSSIDIQFQRTAGTALGSYSLTISGYETNFAQRDGTGLHVRCVR
jgi:hypothetical protein